MENNVDTSFKKVRLYHCISVLIPVILFLCLSVFYGRIVFTTSDEDIPSSVLMYTIVAVLISLSAAAVIALYFVNYKKYYWAKKIAVTDRQRIVVLDTLALVFGIVVSEFFYMFGALSVYSWLTDVERAGHQTPFVLFPFFVTILLLGLIFLPTAFTYSNIKKCYKIASEEVTS